MNDWHRPLGLTLAGLILIAYVVTRTQKWEDFKAWAVTYLIGGKPK